MNDRYHIEPVEIVGGDISAWVALCEELPELIGRGADEDEAIQDVIEQIFARVLH